MTMSITFNPIVKDAVLNGTTQDLIDVLTTHPHLIDTPDEDGDTPLYWAVNNRNTAMATTLLQFGSQAIEKGNWCDMMSPLSASDYFGAVNANKLFVAVLGPNNVHGYMFSNWFSDVDFTLNECPRLRHSVYFRRSLSARLLFTYESRSRTNTVCRKYE